MNDSRLPGHDEQFPFTFRRKTVPAGLQEENWQRIQQSLAEPAPVRRIFRQPVTWAAAATLILALGILWWIRASQESDTRLYRTQYAQVKKIRLPDGSRVTLNANSTLRLSADWTEEGDRQVWLEGEAYFEVEKKPATRQKFVVHAPDLDVEVLGTRFNVNTRRSVSVVALEEGHIKLQLKKPARAVTGAATTPAVIDMKPGEVLKLDTACRLQLETENHIDRHSGWLRNEFHFDNTPLQDIAVMIQDVYGYRMEVDPALLHRAITGDLRATSLSELLDVLQLAFRLKMTVEDKTIIVSRQ